MRRVAWVPFGLVPGWLDGSLALQDESALELLTRGLGFRIWVDPGAARPRGFHLSLPVTANDIFSKLTPAESHEIFEEISAGNRDAYKAAMQVTATRRRLRPVFLEKKPRPDRHEWMRSVLAMKRNEDVGLELLQNWLLGLQRKMITDFLENCGLEHQEGILEEIPPQPDAAKLAGAVDELFAKNPAVAAKVYLHVFQPEEDDEAWPELDRMLDEDPRMAFRSGEFNETTDATAS